MPDVSPFRGVRYDVARVGTLSDVVAPPYDVIDTALQDRLYQASPYNVIRLELNRDEPGDSGLTIAMRGRPGFSRTGFARAFSAKTITRHFTSTNRRSRSTDQKHSRKGFLAQVRLEPIGKGKIYPHEQTMAGPKADRLALYKATGFNLSPIFGLYPDARLLKCSAPSRQACATALPSLQPITSVSRTVSGSSAIRRLTPRSLRLDGRKARFHRRRPPPLRDRPQVSGRARVKPARRSRHDDPSNFCLMMLVGMSDPGLLILPTHRLISGFPGPHCRRTCRSARARVRDHRSRHR